MPQPDKRNHSGLAIQLFSGSSILVDCGEGTEIQLMKSSVRMSRIDYIFITHLHGDHCYGVFGLLHSICQGGRPSPLYIYGPVGLKRMIDTVFEVSGGWHGFPIVVTEFTENEHYELSLPYVPYLRECPQETLGPITVNVCPMKHRIPTFGYVFTEADRPGALDAAAASKRGAHGPMLGFLKAGEDVRTPSGEVICSSDVVAPTIPGRKIAVMQDTSDCTTALGHLNGCDLLIHECTFHKGLTEKALSTGHSTAEMAGKVARMCQAKILCLTHFSPRYLHDSEIPPSRVSNALLDRDADAFSGDSDETSASTRSVRGSASRVTVEMLQREACHSANHGRADGTASIQVLIAEDFLSLEGPKFDQLNYRDDCRSNPCPRKPAKVPKRKAQLRDTFSS
ncbi:Zinc phosphodiesterase ELAC protein 1 [Perkinsus chesapeaki]|uniref:Zinc phosphodiesterase ELAC protein 1 n=1 Tax=Perkinsus chesapeaki TaxID=330153 RepID=A0A7J6MJE0_PERCH|nr:Zinc phosphodiesterase ELAC protein 1 [Perkinsus chesapeaki]